MKQILLIDESSAMRALVAKFLKGKGWDVLEAKDGYEGLLLLLKHQPDLVIIDVVLQYIDGISLLQIIRQKKHLAKTPVVIVSSVADKSTVMALAKLGIQGYVIKPFALDTLIKKVEKILTIANGSETKKIGTEALVSNSISSAKPITNSKYYDPNGVTAESNLNSSQQYSETKPEARTDSLDTPSENAINTNYDNIDNGSHKINTEIGIQSVVNRKDNTEITSLLDSLNDLVKPNKQNISKTTNSDKNHIDNTNLYLKDENVGHINKIPENNIHLENIIEATKGGNNFNLKSTTDKHVVEKNILKDDPKSKNNNLIHLNSISNNLNNKNLPLTNLAEKLLKKNLNEQSSETENTISYSSKDKTRPNVNKHDSSQPQQHRINLMAFGLNQGTIDHLRQELHVNYDIHAVNDLEQAIQISWSHPLKGVLIDLNNTNLDPIDTYKRLQYTPHLLQTPFIALRHADINIQEKAERAGIRHFISDPIDTTLLTQFISVLDNVRKKSRYGATYLQMKYGVPVLHWPEQLRGHDLRETTYEIEDAMSLMYDLGQKQLVVYIGAIRDFDDSHFLLMMSIQKKSSNIGLQISFATQNQNAIAFFRQYADTRPMVFFPTIQLAWQSLTGDSVA